MVIELDRPQDAGGGMAPAATFIACTEVWTPDADTGRLTLREGIYGPHAAFAAVSGGESFGLGEGLPGKAWAEARPVVLKGFRGSYFKRTEAAEAAGLTAAVAVPVFAGDTLKGVLVFLCADDAARTGAIEVWQAAAAVDPLSLNDGYYGTARHFEWVAKHTQFPRGQGLPGGAWAAQGPLLMRDLGTGYRFIRAESAGAAGLTTGLGLPVETPSSTSYVLTLLSARGTPIARRFELWDVPAGGDSAVLVDGLCAEEGTLWATPQRATVGAGPIGEVVATGLPLARAGVDAPGGRDALSLPEGHDAVVALPVHIGGRLAHIVAWYF
ncbi:MAG: GAF domain-containing protein [Pseudomonadota bacterium]